MKIDNKETKFNIGDTVYFIHEGSSEEETILSSKILGIVIKENNSFLYIIKINIFENGYREENSLYATEEKAEEKIKKRRIKVYLSGAIANDKNYVNKFMNAKKEVCDRGYSVLNPIETAESLQEKGVKECMFASIELLRQADIMLLLDKELTKSRGVSIELELARYANIPVADDYKDIDYFYDKKYKQKNEIEEQEE